MHCGIIKLVFIILFINFGLPDAGADELTLDNLEDMYKNITPGYQICIFDGSHCARGQEYCSRKAKTCRSLFPNDASEETKLVTCKEIIQRNETEPGVYDSCVYFFGKLEIRRGFGKRTEDHPHDPHPMRAPGKELCRYPDTFCQLGSEFCNTTSGNCEPLFLPNASDTEKRQRCEQVIRNNITMLQDACTYAFGKMSCSESNVAKKKAAEQASPYIIWGATVTVVLVIGVIVTVFVAVIYCKKLLCFKETQSSHILSEPKNERKKDANDVDPRGEERRRLAEDDGSVGHGHSSIYPNLTKHSRFQHLPRP